ncbi:hypothetical protein EC991_009842 [Linnemannia zychae]|nr:hypothetical protein EC991_009842 [Linnemannia zychae]
MSSTSSSLDLVSNFTCLTSKNNHEEAMRLLKKVATMVRPIMKAHNWKITTLAEFLAPGLLGMNTNRGWKIQLCLRYHNDENRFLPWEDVLGTMLHELAHNIRGPHDTAFYKALDGLNDEYDKIVASGYTGEGFDATGQRLGTRHGGFGPGGVRLGGAQGATLVTNGTRAAAVLAAEKRRQMYEMMLPSGGRKLGESDGGHGRLESTPRGFWEQWHSPGELAAMAAERRAKDQVWCGSSSSSTLSSTGSPHPSPNQSSSASNVKTPTIVLPTTSAAFASSSPSATTPSLRPPILSDSHSNSSNKSIQRTAIIIDDEAPATPASSHGTKRRGSNPSTTFNTLTAALKKPKNETTAQQPDQPVPSKKSQWTEWVCPLCTLLNRPLALQCECCFTHRPVE